MLFKGIIITLVILICQCQLNNGKSKVLKYELRRPLRYFYKRMQLKADLNPLIYHLNQTVTVCSSKLGPYCSFINQRNIQEATIKNIPQQYQAQLNQIQALLPMTSQMARKIQIGQFQGFLISNDLYKKWDKYIAKVLEDQMSNEEGQKYRNMVNDRLLQNV